MTPDMIAVLVILLVAIVLFITEWLRADIVAICIVIVLMAMGLLTTEEALAGFSSTAVLTIAALFIVGGAVFQTGLAAMVGDFIVRMAGTNETRLLLVLLIAITFIAAFISATGMVALMLPAVMSIAQRSNIAPSRLLIPLSFSSLLGGMLTLIGTPPNIIASDTLANAGYEPFNFFSFTPIGLVLAGTGIAYIYFGRRLLPDRRPRQMAQQMETPSQLFELYRLPDNLFRIRIRQESPAIGQDIRSLRLREDFSLNIVSIIRDERTLPHLTPDMMLRENDMLVVQGAANDVGRATARWNMAMVANQPIKRGDIITNEVGIAEVLLRPRSSLIDKTIANFRFGSIYNLTVLNLYRPGVEEPLNIKTTPLKFGDMLLVQGEWKSIFALKQMRHDFIVMGEPEAMQMGAFFRRSHTRITLIIMVLMVLATIINIAPLVLISLVAAVALVLTGCLKMDEAYAAIDWKSLVLIAGLLPMSTALVKVGAVDAVSEGIISVLGGLGPVAILTGVFLITAIFTQLFSNTASALLAAPIALGAAEGIGANPHAFLMAVALAASMTFITPFASPVNMLVVTPGNYRFNDFVRIGTPLFIILSILTIILLPILFPL